MPDDIIMVRLQKSGVSAAIRWITVREAAKVAGLSSKTVIRLAAAGKLKARKIGARYQIDAACLS
jgi:excisionase family DNA binding protein